MFLSCPGQRGGIDNLDEACEVAAEIGYPVIVKASAGGGGSGCISFTTKTI